MNSITKQLLEAIKQDNVLLVQRLLKHPEVDPAAKDNYAIRWAAYNGHVEVVKLLLHDVRVDPSTENNLAIHWAAKRGHVKVVKLLLQDARVREKLTEEEYERYHRTVARSN